MATHCPQISISAPVPVGQQHSHCRFGPKGTEIHTVLTFPIQEHLILGLRPEAVVSQEDRAWGTVWAPLWLLRP